MVTRNTRNAEDLEQEPPFPPLRGAEHIGVSDPDSSNFVAHPWSATHTTGLFTSAFMRAHHEGHVWVHSTTGETAYLEAEEIMMKASLLPKERKSI